jgi:hypothetical protein
MKKCDWLRTIHLTQNMWITADIWTYLLPAAAAPCEIQSFWKIWKVKQLLDHEELINKMKLHKERKETKLNDTKLNISI